MAFPSPPWKIHGQAWFSLFYATRPGDALGVYAAACLSHESGSTLPHQALLVGRLVREDGGSAVQVVDGWADNAAAVEGYRAAFGFPVGSGSLEAEVGGLGPVGRAEWHAPAVAGAHFADTAGVALRMPLRLTTRQPAVGEPTMGASLSGSARSVPCLGVWSIPEDGPLGWLAHKQPFASFRARDARLVLG
ncbi:hypothetical protein [Nocardioides bigeumensis]|uniref:Acetoacetate decarboxylase n=1 Tax=Nocardioides bigeumensis TaxID=433657 RepID=A0ABN2YA62_9ACTN